MSEDSMEVDIKTVVSIECMSCGNMVQLTDKQLEQIENRNYRKKAQRTLGRLREKRAQHAKGFIICGDCGEEKKHCGRGLCRTCYNRQYKRRKK